MIERISDTILSSASLLVMDSDDLQPARILLRINLRDSWNEVKSCLLMLASLTKRSINISISRLFVSHESPPLGVLGVLVGLEGEPVEPVGYPVGPVEECPGLRLEVGPPGWPVEGLPVVG